MSIGTSLGAFHDDEFHHLVNPYLDNPEKTPDNNEDHPDVIQPSQPTILPVANSPWLDNGFRPSESGGTTPGPIPNFRPSGDIEDRRHQSPGDKQDQIMFDKAINDFMGNKEEGEDTPSSPLSRQLGSTTLDLMRVDQIDKQLMDIPDTAFKGTIEKDR